MFIRNYTEHTVTNKIVLDYFPTMLRLLDCNKFAKVSDAQKNFMETAAVVGTKEGVVLVYHVSEISDGGQLVGKTQPGLMYGEVSGMSVQDDGGLIVASSQSGEIISFPLLKSFEEPQK